MAFVALKLVKDSSELLFQMLLNRNSLITKEHLILVRSSTESSLKGICFNRILQLLLGCQNTLSWKNSRSVSECKEKKLLDFFPFLGFHSVSFHPILTCRNMTHCDNISYYEREREAERGREGEGETERERDLNMLTYSLSQTPRMSLLLALVSQLIFTCTGKSLFNLLFCTVCVNNGLKIYI